MLKHILEISICNVVVANSTFISKLSTIEISYMIRICMSFRESAVRLNEKLQQKTCSTPIVHVFCFLFARYALWEAQASQHYSKKFLFFNINVQKKVTTNVFLFSSSESITNIFDFNRAFLWRFCGNVNQTATQRPEVSLENTAVEVEEETETDEGEARDESEDVFHSGLFLCPSEGCVFEFKKYSNLEYYILYGKCRIV